MKKIVFSLMLCSSMLLAAVNLNTALKEELMSVKGIGSVKAQQIIEFRKNNKIKSAEDLMQLKGFGPSIIANIKKLNKNK